MQNEYLSVLFLVHDQIPFTKMKNYFQIHYEFENKKQLVYDINSDPHHLSKISGAPTITKMCKIV